MSPVPGEWPGPDGVSRCRHSSAKRRPNSWRAKEDWVIWGALVGLGEGEGGTHCVESFLVTPPKGNLGQVVARLGWPIVFVIWLPHTTRRRCCSRWRQGISHGWWRGKQSDGPGNRSRLLGFLRWSGMQDRFEVWRVDGSRWGRK